MSLTVEDLKAISDLMDKKFDEKLSPINQRLDKIEERLDVIEEHTEEIRGSTNMICEWLNTYWRDDPDKPFPAREEDIQFKLPLDENILTKA